ncbi:DUF4232 domain-containing protein [Streptomyces coelicoflavus]|nr:DUF4232 domain-containing protein [Streptomyces coelicoflavus]MDI6515019.1 DUF4232 domain-containing protein [Streptomyces coelicoflavus]
MRIPLLRTAFAVSGALVASLLLGACGARTAGSEAGGGGESKGPCEGVAAVGSSPVAGGSPTAGDGAAAGGERDGVRIVGLVERGTADGLPGGGVSATGPCVVAYEVTNQEAEPLTYTIRFSLLDDRGRAMSNIEETVASVGAGKTVRRTLEPGGYPADGMLDAGRVRILGVDRVPSDEAPTPAGSCPASGLRLTADQGDAAMGLRVVGLHLENCGSRAYALEGYPVVQLIDAEHRPVDGVEILRGTDGIPMAGGDGGPPRPVTLRPGESAVSGLAWRNTTEFGEAVNVPYVRVRAEAGSAPVMVAPHLDLGTTGELGVRAWQKDEKAPDGATGESGSGRPGAQGPYGRPSSS